MQEEGKKRSVLAARANSWFVSEYLTKPIFNQLNLSNAIQSIYSLPCLNYHENDSSNTSTGWVGIELLAQLYIYERQARHGFPVLSVQLCESWSKKDK